MKDQEWFKKSAVLAVVVLMVLAMVPAGFAMEAEAEGEQPSQEEGYWDTYGDEPMEDFDYDLAGGEEASEVDEVEPEEEVI